MEAKLTMTNSKFSLFLENGPKTFAVLFFSFSVIEKIFWPSTFYIITRSLNLYIIAPELILSTIVMIEIILIILLFVRPDIGLLSSSIFFGCHILLIAILNSIGIRELCSNQELVSNELGLPQILLNTGASILLLISYWLFKEKNTSTKDNQLLINF
jgi:hypothetical protein